MKFLRTSATLLTFSAFALLAACGGGSGSGYSPVGTPTTNPAPGGSSSPSPSPSPTATPTSAPVGTNTALTINAAPNVVNGDQTWYSSGTTAWNPSAGDTSSGANGSNTIDGLSCNQMGEPTTQYHVHAFVGILNNGTQEAIPSAIGIGTPTEPTASGQPNDNYEVLQAACYYHIHTHDYSGLIHIEDSTLPQTFSPSGIPAYATLQTLFDLWGEPISATGAAGFTGPVAIYTGTPTGTMNGNDLVNTYTLSSSAPSAIQLAHHEAIWIVVGTPPTAGLPQVEFSIEN